MRTALLSLLQLEVDDALHRLLHTRLQADPVASSPFLDQTRRNVILDHVSQARVRGLKVVNKLVVWVGLAQDVETVVPIERSCEHLDSLAFDIRV